MNENEAEDKFKISRDRFYVGESGQREKKLKQSWCSHVPQRIINGSWDRSRDISCCASPSI